MKIIALIAGVAILIVIVLGLSWSRNPPSSRTVASPPDDGHLRIRDLTLDHIRSGRNWKVSNPDELLLDTLNLEDIHIDEGIPFRKTIPSSTQLSSLPKAARTAW
jgi:hypothetical protein